MMFFDNLKPISVPVTGTATLNQSTATINVSSLTTASSAVACTLANKSFLSGPKNTVSVACDALSRTKPGLTGASTTKADAIVLISGLPKEISSPQASASLSPQASASLSPNGLAPNLLDNNLGGVLANPEIHNAYMDFNWDGDNPAAINMASIDGFTANLVTSPYLSSAGQYGVGAATFTGSNQANLLCPPPMINGITDAATLQGWIECMAGPSPIPFTGTLGGVPVPDNNTVYAVYVPSGTQINDLALISCVDYIAYHFIGESLVWQGNIFVPFLVPQRFVYTVVPVQCATLTQQDNNLPGLLDGVTYPATHEIVEAATDPVVLTGWVDNNTAGGSLAGAINILRHGEAADICQDMNAPPERLANGTFVAPYWSNAGNACTPAPSLSLSSNAISFGSQTVFTSGSMGESITNTGSAELDIGRVTISGDSDFAIMSDACSSQALQMGNSCLVSIRFGPHSVGPGSATLNIPSNTPSGTASVSITGTGVAGTTLTALVSSPNPSVFGQPVTYTATVTSPTPGAPSGTVTFRDCFFAGPFCAFFPFGTGGVSGGVATLIVSSQAAGRHLDIAGYSGDPNFAGSGSNEIVQIVNKDATSMRVTSSSFQSDVGTAVTFTATVSAAPPGSGTPSGTVTFNDGATTLSTKPLSAGMATLTISALTPGTHSITVAYSGDGNFNASSGSVFHTVGHTTSTSIASSANPSRFGEVVTFTASVTPNTATGTVTFATLDADGVPVVLGSKVLSGGKATFSTASLPVAIFGALDYIEAVYNGNPNTHFLPSTSPNLGQTVNKDLTKTTLTSSANPSVSGETVTFTATVAALAPGIGTPTGTVTFSDGSTLLGSRTLISGKATLFTAALQTVGGHSITATYDGDKDDWPSTSAALTQTVKQAATSIILTSNRNPSIAGLAVTLTAFVGVKAPGSGTLLGPVTFKEGGITLGTPAYLINGKATLTLVHLTKGSYSITASYGGDVNYAGSTSPVFTEIVN